MPDDPTDSPTTGPTAARTAGVCLWLTGRRGAGKRTIGRLVTEALHAQGRPCALLDDEALSSHLALGPADGGLDSLAWLVRLLVDNGVPTIVTVDTPKRADREPLRAAIPGFVEVHVDAPSDVCIARAGVADPAYEEPIAPDLRIPTGDRDERSSVAQLVSFLDDRGAPWPS